MIALLVSISTNVSTCSLSKAYLVSVRKVQKLLSPLLVMCYTDTASNALAWALTSHACVIIYKYSWSAFDCPVISVLHVFRGNTDFFETFSWYCTFSILVIFILQCSIDSPVSFSHWSLLGLVSLLMRGEVSYFFILVDIPSLLEQLLFRLVSSKPT